MSVATDNEPERPRTPTGPRRLGLSGKLLLMTIPLAMIAGMMIYVPAIANFRVNRLNDRLAAANTAALVLDAAPSGMVPETLQQQILGSIGARAVAIKMGQQRRLLASAGLPPKIDHDIDTRNITVWAAIHDAFETMLETDNHAIRVMGKAPGAAQFIEVVIDEAPLRLAMYRFSRNVLVVALLIAGLTSALVYLALHYLFVRPMRRLTANLVAFHENPENPARIIVPSQRGDEIGVATRELSDMQRDLVSMLQSEEPARSAGTGRLQDQPRSAQSSRVLATAVGPACQRARSAGAALCAKADALAGARDRLLPVDAVVRHARRRPSRTARMVLVEPVVTEVRESAGLATDASITWVAAIERGLSIDADPDQLFRVVLNLVRNAAQALESQPQGGAAAMQIRITGRREGSVAILEVSDTGPGVPAKTREHLFEAFQTSGRPGGSGLGLAIAAELIRAHGGDIHLVEGTIGATFRLSIPDRPVELKSVRNERATA